LGAPQGYILFNYNWTRKILSIEGKCDVTFEFTGYSELDNLQLQPYRTLNQDILSDKIFIERDGELCKAVHVINAYVPTSGSYQHTEFTIHERILKSDIYFITMSDLITFMKGFDPASDEGQFWYDLLSDSYTYNQFMLLKHLCFPLSREDYETMVIKNPLAKLQYLKLYLFIPNVRSCDCRSAVSKKLYDIIRYDGCYETLWANNIKNQIDYNAPGYGMADLRVMVEDWNIPLTDVQKSFTKKKDYVDAIANSLFEVITKNPDFRSALDYDNSEHPLVFFDYRREIRRKRHFWFR
jgi:hypothetical protein